MSEHALMNRVLDQFAILLVTAWVGALWAVGGLVAPLLFQTIPDKMQAGALAGHIFTWLAYVGVVSAFLLLLIRLFGFGVYALKQGYFWIVVLMLTLVLIGQLGIQPVLAHLKAMAFPADVMQSVFADRFRNWHGIASIAYLLECLLGGVLVLKAR